MRGVDGGRLSERAVELARVALSDTQRVVGTLERLLAALSPEARPACGDKATEGEAEADIEAAQLRAVLEDLQTARRAADASLRDAQELSDRTFDALDSAEREREQDRSRRAITGVIRRVPGRKTA